jgi:15-cis-phytoene synthase
MQCTNIARDVIPDLKGGRLYLPREWLLTEQIFEILSGHEVLESAVVSAVQKLLALGQEHYNRGLQGLSFLDSRSRFAIRVAADCYSAIGRRVIAGGRLRRARAVVPFGMKVALAVRAFGRSAVSA